MIKLEIKKQFDYIIYYTRDQNNSTSLRKGIRYRYAEHARNADDVLMDAETQL